MRRFFWLCLGLLQILAHMPMPCTAASKGYNWYCVHVKDHVQPQVDAGLSFIEDLGGYYIDRCNRDPEADDKVIYLTFDAGYENGNITRILDVLKEEDVKGSFFILGNLITKNTELVRRMADEGHTVGNHTVHHRDMSSAADEVLLEELRALEELYRTHVGGELSHFYRPPEGRFSRENLECLQKNGYKTVFWSFAYPDWSNDKQMSPEKAKRIILDNVHNGEVMLLHPTSDTNASILRDVIRTLKEMGYRFGTLEELTEERDASIQPR